MGILDNIKKIYHVFIKRDVLGPIGISKFGMVGSGSTIYRPEVVDRNLGNVQVGSNTTILTGSRIQLYPCDGRIPRICFGDGCYIGYHNTFLAGGNITIGNNVLMASNIMISSENHSSDPESPLEYMHQPLKCADVKIGDGSWIGERVMIMPGATIGKKCVVGGGSIVTHDIPDYCIAVGSPAKVIKKYDFAQHKWIKQNKEVNK